MSQTVTQSLAPAGVDLLDEWFGTRTMQAREERLRRFWAGAGRVMFSSRSGQHEYRQALDHDVILSRVGPNLQAQVGLAGENLPSFFPDFGAVWPAPYWGGKLVPSAADESKRFLEPVAHTIDEALELVPRAVDDPEMVAAQGLGLYRAACEQLGTEQLWYRLSGLQGPLNTAGLVLAQQELFMAMFSEPAKVQAFLATVTDFLIDYYRYQVTQAHGKVCGDIWPYHWLPIDLGVCMTEDLMPLLGPELYREFGLPCVQRIAESAGGIFLHCCGRYVQHAAALAELGELLRGVEFHYPYTCIEGLQDTLPEHTVYVPYLALDKQDDFEGHLDYFRHLLTTSAPHTRWWFVLNEDQAASAEYVDLFGLHMS